MSNTSGRLRAGAIVLTLAGLLASATSPSSAAVRLRGDELKRSWGLEAINAEAAFRSGLSGRGVKIALVDCGVQGADRELLRNVSRRSKDLLPRRRAAPPEPHGAYVAAPLAASVNGRGMAGVAHNATLISIRADFDGGLDGQCAFYPSDLARALDYAVDQKARIIVLPLQARNALGQPFEAALERVVKSGAAVVIAAGNRKGDEPTWPARYAVDPRYAGSIVVAGASSYYGSLASWSNRAGSVQPWYVAAPGEWVLTNCREKCKIVSGTSFSASYVAGALALMMEHHAEWTGRQAVDAVLDATRDAGDPGTDPVYGRGVLDLAAAFPSAD